MHRKFIALILATSVAVTGLSAAPAFADGKTARQFGWLALLGIVALAVQDSNRKRAVTRNYTYTTPPRATPAPRALPPQVSRKVLPQQCLRRRNVDGRQRNLFGAGCLNQNRIQVKSLPYACQLGYAEGRDYRIGYEPQCLREHGYRTAHR